MALDLHRRLLVADIESQFAYGWGEKGGKSSFEASVPFSFQVGRSIQVATNILVHRFLGIDCLQPSGEGRNSLIEAICWADVVHLHVIHSYFLPFVWFIRELIRADKPVVWTAHDYWILTGRCAFTEGCERWRCGCGSCPTQNNYPPAHLDFSSSQFKTKRHLLAQLGSRLHIVTPSEFLAQTIRDGLPGVAVCVIPNWIDSEFESSLNVLKLSSEPIKLHTKKIKVMVTANDLSDPSKVDRQLISQLLDIAHIEIHTIGQNSPFSGARVVNHGRIEQRKRMIEVISSSDVALFTSEKDTFGLVMIEALACGVPIIAIQSLAAREVLSQLGIKPIENKGEIVGILRDGTLPSCYTTITPAILCANVLNAYSGKISTLKYVSTYERAVL